MTTSLPKGILVLDFGSQYTQLIVRNLRQLGVYSVVESPRRSINWEQWGGVILSGGPDSVATTDANYLAWLSEPPVPILGICFGMQLLAQRLGGTVACKNAEFGKTEVARAEDTKLFRAFPKTWSVIMSHRDSIISLPPFFAITAATCKNSIAAFEYGLFYGVQWHPEVSHSNLGVELLRTFALEICGLPSTWDTRHILAELEARVAERVGDQKLVMACSGGVDSSVAATVIHRVIGRKFHGIFVDSGLLRHEDSALYYLKSLPFPLMKVKAKTLFLKALHGITSPERKRKIIGKTFIKIFAEHAKSYPFLGQGTIYPDVIESTGPRSSSIKSHHNVGGLPKTMHFQLVEPLRMLFKDEVIALGRALQLPEQLLAQQPFPGPGLAVRIMGPVTSSALSILRQADHIFRTILREHGECPNQFFAVYLPQKTTGVVGDERRHGITIALRAVTTENFMTAKVAHLPLHVLTKTAQAIIEAIPQCARVVYDVTDKPPATIEWE